MPLSAPGTAVAQFAANLSKTATTAKRANPTPGVTVLPPVTDPGNALTRGYNDYVANPVNNYATGVASQAGTTAGAAGQQSFADRMGLGSLGSAAPYVLGAGIGGLAGGGLSLIGGMGSKRKRKDRLGDAATGALLGAGAGLLGGGLYSMYGGSKTPEAPPAAAPPAPPPAAVDRAAPGNPNPGGLTGRQPSATPADVGTNTPAGGLVDQARQRFSTLGRSITTPGEKLDYTQGLDTVDDAAGHLYRAAVTGGNLEDARALNEAYQRAMAAKGDPVMGGDPGLANADYAGATRMLADRMGRGSSQDPLPAGGFDARPEAVDAVVPFGLAGATGRQVASNVAGQLRPAVAAAADKVVPPAQHHLAANTDRAMFSSPFVRTALEGTAGAGLARGLVAGARQAVAGRPGSLGVPDRARLLGDKITPKPTIVNATSGGGLAGVRNFFSDTLTRGRVNPLRAPAYALGGTAPRFPDYSAMSAQDLLATPGMETAVGRAVAGGGGQAPITLGGRPITLDMVRKSLKNPGGPGTIPTETLREIVGRIQTPRPAAPAAPPVSQAPGLAVAGTVTPGRAAGSTAARAASGVASGAGRLVGNSAKAMVNPRNMLVGGALAAARNLGRNASPTTPLEDLTGLGAGGLSWRSPRPPIAPTGETDQRTGLAPGDQRFLGRGTADEANRQAVLPEPPNPNSREGFAQWLRQRLQRDPSPAEIDSMWQTYRRLNAGDPRP